MIISNSTPLIAFARIGQLVLLRNVVGTMIIPQAVADEISEYAQAKRGGINLSQEDWITVQSVQSELQVHVGGVERSETHHLALAEWGVLIENIQRITNGFPRGHGLTRLRWAVVMWRVCLFVGLGVERTVLMGGGIWANDG